MADLFEDIFAPSPLDPTEAARRAHAADAAASGSTRTSASPRTAEGFAVTLDGRPVRTPARRALAAPTRPLGEALAAEWDAQADVIDPARMPLTRLANTIIDGVAAAARESPPRSRNISAPISSAIAPKAPDRLVVRQAQRLGSDPRLRARRSSARASCSPRACVS